MSRTWLIPTVVLVTLGLTIAGCQKEESKPGTGSPPIIVVAPGGGGAPAGVAVIPKGHLAVVHVNVGAVWNSEPVKQVRTQLGKQLDQWIPEFEKAVGIPLPELEGVTVVVPPPTLGEPPNPFVVVRTTRPYDEAKITRAMKLKEGEFHVVNELTFLAGPASAVKTAAQSVKLDDKGFVTDALRKEAGQHHVVAAIDVTLLPAEVMQRARQELPPPAQFLAPLLQTKAATATLDIHPGLQLTTALEFGTAAQAQEAEKALKQGLTLVQQLYGQFKADLAKRPEGAGLLPMLKSFDDAVQNIRITSQGTRVTSRLKIEGDSALPGIATALLLPAVQKVREAANRMQSQNNLHQIGIAMHNYHNDFNTLPPAAILSKDGKPLLSWRVAILPYIEQQNLYQLFKLDEPWDSEHNKKLIPMMPKTYAHPAAPATAPGMTHYQVFAGKGAIFGGPKSMNLSQITAADGAVNTLLVCEAADPVPWTKPADLPFDPDKPLPKLGGLFATGFNAGFADSSVRHLKKDIDQQLLRALITATGGENVRVPD